MREKFGLLLVLVMTLCSILGMYGFCAADADKNEFAGIWYLDAVYDPDHGSFGEDYIYAIEYGVNDMLVITGNNSINVYSRVYDTKYDDEKSGFLKKMNPYGEISMELRNGYLLFVNSEGTPTHIYSKTSPASWYEAKVNKDATAADFVGKWNLVNEYQTAAADGDRYSWDDDAFFNTELRVCLKNWSDYPTAADMLNYYFREESEESENNLLSFMANDTEVLNGKFQFSETRPWMKIHTDTEVKQSGNHVVRYRELYGNNYMIEFDVAYTEEEWEKGIDIDKGVFPYSVKLYRKSISETLGL
ncbi:MAG: hypothetical protein IJI14_02970 [Anaerolineaceae bacterium]|nr:hypothetical protein [Anaerolineaceae bacterium]